jgi:hypothetical protein
MEMRTHGLSKITGGQDKRDWGGGKGLEGGIFDPKISHTHTYTYTYNRSGAGILTALRCD